MASTPPAAEVCVIGAGASGIATIKALADRDIPYDCFELGDRVGGVWVLGNSNGRAAAYSSLHINTSRRKMQYAAFPMSGDLPEFPRHDQVAAYFDAFVDRFGLRDSITFSTAVEHVEPLDAGRGGFDVTLASGETRHYRAVVVATGHHWAPRWPTPSIPGAETFEGEQIHAHDYREETQLAGKRVVVLGLGNSAVDIAVDASYHASSTVLAARRGVHVIPKSVLGRPYDQLPLTSEWTPAWLRLPVARVVMRTMTGPMTRYGLPKPDHRFGDAHPTVSGRLLDRLSHGEITPKPTIASLEGREVVFADGSRVEADLVVYCTGYSIAFPFLAPSFIDPGEANHVRLYLNVFHPEVAGLSFVGLVQPLGAIMPVAERQAELVAAQLAGSYTLPDAAVVQRWIDRYLTRIGRRFGTSSRHTIEVDFEDYMRLLRIEAWRGRRRTPSR
jgi:hypothetical protein